VPHIEPERILALIVTYCMAENHRIVE